MISCVDTKATCSMHLTRVSLLQHLLAQCGVSGTHCKASCACKRAHHVRSAAQNACMAFLLLTARLNARSSNRSAQSCLNMVKQTDARLCKHESNVVSMYVAQVGA